MQFKDILKNEVVNYYWSIFVYGLLLMLMLFAVGILILFINMNGNWMSFVIYTVMPIIGSLSMSMMVFGFVSFIICSSQIILMYDLKIINFRLMIFLSILFIIIISVLLWIVYLYVVLIVFIYSFFVQKYFVEKNNL